MMKNWIQAVALGLCAVTGLANASPLWQVKGGQTTIQVDEAMVEYLADIEIERIKPGNYKASDGRLRFSIASGAVDTEVPVGEIYHRGGVSLSNPALGESPVVSLQNLAIDMLGETPVITGIVTVTGGEEPEVRGRLPLFNVGGELEMLVEGNGQLIRLNGAELTLTAEAAAQLAELGLGALEAETVVAHASSKVQLRKPDTGGKPDDKGKPGEDDEEDEGEEGDDSES